MCDLSYSYQAITERTVTTRLVHECACCMKNWPAGTRMELAVGLFEGEWCRTYCCPVCAFTAKQPDHSALHFCWEHFWPGGDASDEDWLVWEYVRECLASGTVPQAAEAERIRAAALAAFLEEADA